MNLSEFLVDAIQQIKNGVDKANDRSPDYKAIYPQEIMLELSLDADGELARNKEHEAINAKITLNLAHYPWNKMKD